MNNNFASLVALCVTFAMVMGCSATRAQSSADFNRQNAVVVVTKTISNQTINLGKNTRLKFQGGCFRNCRIQGNSTVVEANGVNMVFDNCSFSGTFVNSQLKATNFGCIPDMTSRSYVWNAKDGRKINTKIRQGTNNKKALESMAQFCSGSSNVTVELNGAFFTPVVDNTKQRSEGMGNMLKIKDAQGLTIHGGTIIQGIYFYNCSALRVRDISFVGLHELHDFPRMFNSTASFTNTNGAYYERIKRNGYTRANTANIVEDQYIRFGVAGSSTMRFITEEGKISKDIVVENCHIEMRSEGIGTGAKGNHSNVQDMVIRNCDFSHIYFQPIGFSGISNVTVDNVTVDYCLQPFSMGRWANQVRVQNSKFYNCKLGPKQELDLKSADDALLSFGNVIDNCYIQITDKLEFVDLDSFIFLAGQAKPGDTYVIRNTVFDVQKTMPTAGFLCRASGLKLENVTVNINYRTDHEKYDMARLFNTGGRIMHGVNYVPHIILDNVTINANTRFAYLASSTSGMFDLTLNRVTLNGKASCVYPAFSGLNSLTMEGTNLALPMQSTLIERTPKVTLNNVTCTDVGSMVYNSGGISDDLNISITNSNLKSKGALLNMNQAGRSSLRITGNAIQCGSVVNFANEPRVLTMNMTNNQVTNTGTVVFAGLEKAARVFAPQNVTMSANVFYSAKSATLYGRSVGANARKVFTAGNRLSGAIRLP